MPTNQIDWSLQCPKILLTSFRARISEYMMPIARQIFTLSNRQKCCVHALSRHWQLATPSHPSLILPSTVCPNCRKPLSFPCHIAFRYSGSGTMILFFFGKQPILMNRDGQTSLSLGCVTPTPGRGGEFT